MAQAVQKQQEIQDVVRKFLDGGSAQDIPSWARGADNCLPLVESAGVVEKLVDELMWGPKQYYYRPYCVLCDLLKIGTVAQDAIARAHDGRIFNLFGWDPYLISSESKNGFFTQLTKNHPTNAILLSAARDSGQRRSSVRELVCAARGGATTLVELVRKKVQGGDNVTAARAMHVLFNAQQDKHAATALPPASIAVLASIVNVSSNSSDATVSTIEDQVVYLFVKQFHMEEARVALTQSPLDMADQLNTLKSETTTTRSRLLAVVRLRSLLETSGSNALNIVSAGGVCALVNGTARTESGVLVEPLQEQASHVLTGLVEASSDVRNYILEGDIIDYLVQLARSGAPSHKTMALDALRVFLREESGASRIARRCGIMFLIQLLHHDKQNATKQRAPAMKILSCVLASDDAIESFRYMVNSERAIALLFSLVDDKPPGAVENQIKLAEILGGLIPFLVARLGNDNGSLLETLTALEPLSRAAVNQHYFLQQEGVKQLAKLLQASVNAGVKMPVVRILANIACQNCSMSTEIVDCDVVGELVAMMNSTDVKLQTVALMALRNLTNNHTNRCRIGSPDVEVRLIQIIKSGKAMKQREAAVAVLGNLARLPVNQKNIICSGGVAVVLAFIPGTTTPQQLETAAGALWVFAESVKYIREKGGVAIIQKALELHQQHLLPWATRLLKRLNT